MGGPNVNEFRLVRRHMPELDVFRGIAILSVVVYHGFYWMNRGNYPHGWQTQFVDATVFGWLGVNLFFILSGFLITGILLDTKSAPGYYRSFYIKRALRIIPALAVTLMLVVPLRQSSVAGLGLSIVFLVNYAKYFGVTAVYGPLWSLAVEEHFYLLWPTVVHRFKTITIAGAAVGLCLLEPVLRYFSARFRLGDPHDSTHLIADYLAGGALLAIFARSRFATRGNSLLLGGGLLLVGPILLVSGLSHGILHRGTSFGDGFQVIPFNFMFSGALVLALALNLRFFADFWTSPLRYLGRISYGLYLYHILVFSVASGIMAHYNFLQGEGDFCLVTKRFVVMLVPSLLIAEASRRWLEQPFLDMKTRLIPLGRS